MAIILGAEVSQQQPAFLYALYPSGAAVTATDSAAGTSPADVLIATEDTYWRPANTTGDKALVIDLVNPMMIDYLALLGSALDGVLLEVRGSTDNFAASDELVSAEGYFAAALNAGWIRFDQAAYRYIKLIFSGIGTDFAVAHVCLGLLQQIPWLEEDADTGNVSPDGEHLYSSAGMYVGSTQQKAMRELTINIGQITQTEYDQIRQWADACIKTMSPFYFVPNGGSSEIYFGTVEKGRFSAPMVNGLHEVKSMKFTTRAI